MGAGEGVERVVVVVVVGVVVEEEEEEEEDFADVRWCLRAMGDG